MKKYFTIILFCIVYLVHLEVKAQNKINSTSTTLSQSLLVNDILNNEYTSQIDGMPKEIECPYGKAVAFNGTNDGITIDTLPVSGLDQLTIEVIFCPQKGGNFEQRYLHFGETKGDRILLEMRSTGDNWYLDAFVCSNSQKKTLVNPEIQHPLNSWYHIAFVIDHDSLSTYVNHKLEMQEPYNFHPINEGKTSIGVRQNKVSWFKGDIYKIKISPSVLKPDDFISLSDNL